MNQAGDLLPFEADGLSIDRDFVRCGSTVINTSKIKRLHRSEAQSGRTRVFAAWAVAMATLLIWLAAPVSNAPLLFWVLVPGGYAFYKQRHPSPIRYRIWINTGGLASICVIETENRSTADHVHGLLEAALLGRP
ncbi:DUF6232 family protein [Altererythrobacter sp.]|uniref:DUF6232 family protein n=1 Tax=Altererythrobacter sp. TaxID=1872480 RepID=UPI003D06AA14